MNETVNRIRVLTRFINDVKNFDDFADLREAAIRKRAEVISEMPESCFKKIFYASSDPDDDDGEWV